jgi:hypothetical protein
MSDLDLQQFCVKEEKDTEWLKSLMKPWVANGWEYAADCGIAIRIPTTKSATPPPECHRNYHPEIERSFATDAIPEDELTPWPQRNICETCNGTGVKGTQICSKCNGDGYFLCSECGSEAECPKCGRSGHVPRKCSDCGGKNLVQMDSCYVSATNYQRINTLPNLRYKENNNNPIYFRFDGGEGSVMITIIGEED